MERADLPSLATQRSLSRFAWASDPILARERALAKRLGLPFLLLSGLSELVFVLDLVLTLHMSFLSFLLEIPALLWFLLCLGMGSGGFALWSLVALLDRSVDPWRDRRKRFVARLALAAACAVPFGLMVLLSQFDARHHVFLTIYEDELLEHVERRAGPDNPFFRESSDEDPITLIGAVNYSISDYYWVIHAPGADGRRLQRGLGGFEYEWAQHVRGPWYVMFR
jgi:hypothetical protein